MADEIELKLEEWRDVFKSAIANAERKHKWMKQADKAMKIYRCDREDEMKVYYPTLDNVVQIQQGQIINKAPEVVVTGTNELSYNDDILAHVAKDVINYFAEENNFADEIDKFSASAFAASNGAIRVNDDLTFTMVNHENCILEPCSDYAQCDWIAFKHYISKGVYVNKWGEPTAEEYKDETKAKGYCVYELWDKQNNLVWWLSDAHNDTLDVGPPHIKFKNFYPVAKPYFNDCKTLMFEPVIEYQKWNELDSLIQIYAQREKVVSEGIKAGYFYEAAAFGDLSKIEFTADQQGIPVNLPDEYLDISGQFDINKAISYWDNKPAIEVLMTIQSRRMGLLDEVNKITGISNEMQAISDARETATAQNIKQGYGSSRQEKKRRGIHSHVRDTYKIYWEAINAVIGIDEMLQIHGGNVPDELIAQMNAGALSGYEIDIETQTTLAINERDERAEKLESLGALSTMIGQLAPLVDSGKMTMPVLVEFMKMVTASYPSSQTINDELDTLPQVFDMVQQLNGQLGQQGQQMQQLQQAYMQMEQENLALKQSLQETTQIDQAKTIAETKKTLADAHLKVSDTVKKEMEAVKIASEQAVDPGVMLDEKIALDQIQYPQ